MFFIKRIFLPLVLGSGWFSAGAWNIQHPDGSPTTATVDTTILVDQVQVTAIKQGRVLRSQPVASTVVGQQMIERNRIHALNRLSEQVPNLHIPDYGSRMTSSIYVRGLGARIDQPAIGLNVDNVPILHKDNFDTELVDVERIEVLRGPQSTLYGRNTMGGVVNLYTLSPLHYQGTRAGLEYGSGNTWRLRISDYELLTPKLGMSIGGYYNTSDGLYENNATGRMCDWERMGGGRWRMQWHGNQGWQVDNTFSCSFLRQGGYPYAYIGPDIVREGVTVARSGEIAWNDPCGYRRTTVSDGLTLRRDTERYAFSSITSWHYSDDEMNLDQDFLPISYFTLRQSRKEHAITEDLVIRSQDGGTYGWLVGAFGFYRHGRMSAPVHFKEAGMDELIFDHANEGLGGVLHFDRTTDELRLGSDFRMPAWGAALYHESRLQTGHWHFSAGVRLDLEHTALRYHSQADLDFAVTIPDEGTTLPRRASIDDRNRPAHTYVECLPRVSVMYAFDEMRNLYFTIAKGYKAGGFNTQIFSDILQEKLKAAMVSGGGYQEQDIMSYRPEQSWNVEFGGHFSCMEGAIRGDFALFWIDCRNQQLTVFPQGSSTGRMMTNAGHTRSKGVEIAIRYEPWRTMNLNASWGFTDARFVRYNNGQEDFRNKRVPYAPRHTLHLSATQRIQTGWKWPENILLQASMCGTGSIAWNEQNDRMQGFYTMCDASIRFEHKHLSIDLFGRNLGDRRCDIFYFKSMGREFVQRGRPRTFGIRLTFQIR